MSAAAELEAILARARPDVAALARRVIGMLDEIQPDLVGIVKPGWGSVNYRHKRAGFICAVFPLADHVALYFEHGRQLSNDDGLLQGEAKQTRFIRLEPDAPIPEGPIGLLLAEAIALRG